MKTILLWTFYVLSIAGTTIWSSPVVAQTASQVLVIYAGNHTGDLDNNGIQDSLQVAEYYRDKRGVPSSNLLSINISKRGWSGNYNYEEGTLFYQDMVLPIKNWLANSDPDNDTINILLMSYGLPVTLGDSKGRGLSIDSILMDLNNIPESGQVYGSSNPYLESNPGFFDDHGSFSHDLYKKYGKDMYLVTRLDGPRGPRGCMNLVDQARYGDIYLSPNSVGYKGNIYVDADGRTSQANYTDEWLGSQEAVQSGNYGGYLNTDLNIAYGEHFALGSGFPLKLETTGDEIGDSESMLFKDGTSAYSAPEAFLYGGWYSYSKYNLDTWEWLPGSVATDLDSVSLMGYRLRESIPSGPFGTSALNQGVSCVLGVTDEPYTSGAHRPNIMIWGVLSGFSFAEVAGLSAPYLNWMTLSIGDPLYQPLRPGKTWMNDDIAPVITLGYPQLTHSSNEGYVVKVQVNDSPQPEVCRAVLEWGTDTSYGHSYQWPGKPYWRYHELSFSDLPVSTTIHYRVVLTDPAGNTTVSDDQTFTTIQQSPFGGVVTELPSVLDETTRLQIEHYDEGGEGIAYHDLDPDDHVKIVRSGVEGVELMPQTGDGTPAYVIDTRDGEWLEYTINASHSGEFDLTLFYMGRSYGGGSVRILLDGIDVTGVVTMPQEDNTWGSLSLGRVSITAGIHVIRLDYIHHGDPKYTGNYLDYLEFVLADIDVDPTFALTINNGGSDGAYTAGTVVAITADIAPIGKEFEVWTGDVEGIADVNSASTTITMPGSAVTVIATLRDMANTSPVVDAGSNQTINLPIDTVNLDASVSDDGSPIPPGVVTVTWSKISGPGTAIFGYTGAIDTTVHFSEEGIYVLQLLTDDGELQTADTIQIIVNPEPPASEIVTLSDSVDTSIDGYYGTAESFQRRVVVTSDGALVAFYWGNYIRGWIRYIAYSISHDNGTTWTAPQNLQDDKGKEIWLTGWNPASAVSIDENDNIYIVYYSQINPAGHYLMKSSYTAGAVSLPAASDFSRQITSKDDPSGWLNTRFVNIIKDSEGGLWFFRKMRVASEYSFLTFVHHSTDDGLTWTQSRFDNYSRGGYHDRVGVVLYNGYPFAVLADDNAGGVLSYRYWDGLAWSTSTPLPGDVDGVDGRFSMTVTDDNRTHLVYEHAGLQYTYYDGTEWSDAVEVSSEGSMPSLTTDGSRLWCFYTNADLDLVYKMSSDGFAESASEAALTQDGDANFFAATPVRSNGVIPVIWTAGSGAPYEIKATLLSE